VGASAISLEDFIENAPDVIGPAKSAMSVSNKLANKTFSVMMKRNPDLEAALGVLKDIGQSIENDRAGLRSHQNPWKTHQRLLIWLIIFAVLISIALGFFLHLGLGVDKEISIWVAISSTLLITVIGLVFIYSR